MSTSKKRDIHTEGSQSSKRVDTGKGKDTAESDTDSDSFFDVPYMPTLAEEFRYFDSNSKALGEQLASVPFLIERPIDKPSFNHWGVRQTLKDRWLLGTVRLPNKSRYVWFEKSVVREFYANLQVRAGDEGSDRYGKVYIRHNMYEFTPSKLNELLGTKNVGRLPTRICNDKLAKDLTGGRMRHWPVVGLRRRHLSKIYAILHEIGCANWFPTRNNDDVTVDQAVVLYSVERGLEFDMGEFIFRRILEDAEQVPKVLGFPMLIFALLCEQDYQVPKAADFNGEEPIPINITPELDLFRTIVENQLNVIRGEVATFEAQIRSFFDPLPVQPPASP